MGYAFVNFITVQDLLLFAKTQIGVKWCVALLVEFLARPERVAGTCTRARRPSRCVTPRTSESFATPRISPRVISFLRQLRGKESLVEKFKNSCIMDEKEAWRPKIYFSDGPNQGLPEPFPPPTHLRRKERSQHNRGALFVPGTHHQPSGGGGLYHHRPQPPRMTVR